MPKLHPFYYSSISKRGYVLLSPKNLPWIHFIIASLSYVYPLFCPVLNAMSVLVEDQINDIVFPPDNKLVNTTLGSILNRLDEGKNCRELLLIKGCGILYIYIIYIIEV